MTERGDRPEQARVADEGVEPAPALGDCRPQPVERREIGEIGWHEGGASAVALDRVVELFEPPDGAGERDDMAAGPRQGERGGPSDAARGARDERDAALIRRSVRHFATRLRATREPAISRPPPEARAASGRLDRACPGRRPHR